MTVERIIARFRDIPQKKDVEKLQNRIDELSRQQRQLIREIQEEEEKIADKLDLEYPRWRIDLANKLTNLRWW